MSTLHVENLKGPTSGANANKIIVPSGQTLTAPGHVLQVKQATSTTYVRITTGSSSTWYDISGTVTITPISASSKIAIFNSAGGLFNPSISGGVGLRIVRNIGNSTWNTASSRARHGYAGSGLGTWVPFIFDYNYLDSPNTTSSVQYKVQLALEQNGDIRINDSDNDFSPTTSEGSLIVMEIAA